MKKGLILGILFILISLNFVLAWDFNVNLESLPDDYYQGETVELEASVTPEVGWGCYLNCKWATPDMGEENICGGCGIPNGERKDFIYKTIASGNGEKELVLDVSCRVAGDGWFCIESSEVSKKFNHTLTFGYDGDNVCQFDKNEDCFESDDCICGENKKCKEDLSRVEDEIGCTTYCGNEIVENSYENCTNCPFDVGRCDGANCISAEDCEGGYCIHEICSSNPYIKGDGFCDSKKEENCKNSVLDCICESYERCNINGVCEFYCGNGVCEEPERGICQLDCQWCGDKNCQENEDCSNCQDDCGFCEIDFIKGDGFCEYELGENCKNSDDCGCENFERCGSRGRCETYCGNGICEAEEVGKCKDDCEWCGDEVCDSSRGENCVTCENDCGICESEEQREKIIEETERIIKENLRKADEQRLKIIYYAIVIIVSVLIVYVAFKLIRGLISKKK